MSDADYSEKSMIVFFPEVSGAAVTLEVSYADDTVTARKTPGCCDLVTDTCDKDVVSAVKLRVKDPPGRTTRVFSSEVAGQWARLPTGGPATYSQTTISVPVPAGGETVLGLVIYLDDPAGPTLRRTQVVIIRHEPA